MPPRTRGGSGGVVSSPAGGQGPCERAEHGEELAAVLHAAILHASRGPRYRAPARQASANVRAHSPMRFSLRVATAPLVRASAAVLAACRSLMAAVTVAIDGEGVGKAVLPVIPFKIPWA
jgi:hypothetical protein